VSAKPSHWIAHLGLAGDGLDHLAEDDADADAGADGAETTTDAEGDRLAGVGPGIRLGEEGHEEGEGVHREAPLSD
jgi:hypothetical protein